MERVGREVQRELARFGPAPGMAELVRVWAEAVGAEIARNAWPARIARDGTLHVSTSSSAWAFELAQLEATVRERLAAAVPEFAPQRLRFTVGPLPEPAETSPESRRAPAREPTPTERERGVELAAGIADENLRKVVARTAAMSLARRSDNRSV